MSRGARMQDILISPSLQDFLHSFDNQVFLSSDDTLSIPEKEIHTFLDSAEKADAQLRQILYSNPNYLIYMSATYILNQIKEDLSVDFFWEQTLSWQYTFH